MFTFGISAAVHQETKPLSISRSQHKHEQEDMLKGQLAKQKLHEQQALHYQQQQQNHHDHHHHHHHHHHQSRDSNTKKSPSGSRGPHQLGQDKLGLLTRRASQDSSKMGRQSRQPSQESNCSCRSPGTENQPSASEQR